MSQSNSRFEISPGVPLDIGIIEATVGCVGIIEATVGYVGLIEATVGFKISPGVPLDMLA